jgi:hypothetical protein
LGKAPTAHSTTLFTPSLGTLADVSQVLQHQGLTWLARGNKLLGEGLSRLLWRYVLFLNLMPSGLYISTHTATMGSEMLRGVYPERSEGV